ncbi:small gtp-binding protein domain [Anaeramoeba ignava]|uniref:Small gtp-binding protein domain n=1 Tax=Anaeramoeba ignava TaxID=1746090 RepID=A0A9Q0REE4_ANAIG|nr:small gtp-binding protein domain [Anaeramoeba ignava]
MEKYKILFVSDHQVGKTTLLMTYEQKKFPEEYLPVVYDNLLKNMKIENEEFQLIFWDTRRSEDYDRLFILSYPGTDLIVICFAIDNYNSFQNIESFWIPEIEHYSPNTKKILIGTKIDLRNNEERINQLKERNEKFVTKEEGIELAKKINAIKYFECSSLNQKGIETIFNEIALICVGKYGKEKEKKKGCILN